VRLPARAGESCVQHPAMSIAEKGTLRTSKPEYAFTIASEVVSHHRRLRYRWDMHRNGRTLMEGLDIVTIAESGLIERVDGFFGPPTPIKDVDSGVPAALRRSL